MTNLRLIPTLTRLIATVAVASLILPLSACKKAATGTAAASKAPAAGATVLDSVEQRVSYGVGYNMGSGIAQQSDFAVDQAALRAGLEDGLARSKTRISAADLEAAFQALKQRLAAAGAEAAGKALAAGTAFLNTNKARAGVTTTASGLQYEVLATGQGPKAKASDTVVVRYHGTLIDGTVFDSSVERGDTAEFQVTGVIPGWTEALQLMAAGDKWKLFIPANLAYGPRAAGKIPSNSALVFEVELVQIK